MVNWGDILADVAQEIAEHLEFDEDREVFSQVCSAWRSARKNTTYVNNNPVMRHCQPPLLVLADPPRTPHRRFYSMVNGKVRKTDVPFYDESHSHDRYFSSRGWLISLTQVADKITLFNPFLAAAAGESPPVVIEAPTVPNDLMPQCRRDWEDTPWLKSLILFYKFILSSPRPTTTDFVAVIFEIHYRLGFWSIGHDRWVKPITKPGNSAIFDPGYCHDVCFHGGKFYAINDDTQVIAFATDDQINWYPKTVMDLKNQGIDRWDYYLPHCYIVGEWEQDVILVLFRLIIRNNKKRKNKHYSTKRFYVFELNVGTQEARRITNLGNRAIFVGFNSTFFVEAPSSGDERGCKPNCIYFTDDNYEAYGCDNARYGGGSDMGIYSLDESKVLDDHVYQGPCASRYSFITPPMWIENSQFL